MWIDLKKLSKVHQAYIASIGRAITVAQHLEATARFVIRVYESTEADKSGKTKDFDELKELMKLLDNVLLGRMVRRFEQYGEFSESDVEILKLGTEARNFMAHKSALIVSEFPDRPDELIQQVKLYKIRVNELCNADNLVSSWSYEIQENEPTPKQFFEEYPLKLSSWILEPINDISLAG